MAQYLMNILERLGYAWRRRSTRVRRYATPPTVAVQLRASSAPPLPAGLLPVHGPAVGPVDTVRPYVIDTMHCRRRRRARLAAVDSQRLAVAVLMDLDRAPRTEAVAA